MLLILALAALLLCYLATGELMYRFGARTPKPLASNRNLVRTANRRIMNVGEVVIASLHLNYKKLEEKLVKTSEPRRTDVILIIDHSISMGSGPASPLEVVKRAAKQFVRCADKTAPIRIGVIQFDTGAQVIASLDGKLDDVEKQIEGISMGGGTAIDQGLLVANQHFVEQGRETYEKVVILLSDGCSDQTAAVEQAERLKQELNCQVYAVALGDDVDKETLIAIASKDSFIEIKRLSDLIPVYEVLARTISTSYSTRVKIHERYLGKDAFLLTGCRPVFPDSIDLAERTLLWDLPFVSSHGIEIPYELRGLRPGWWRIAENPAVAEIAPAEQGGSPIEVRSNRSPHVLVLPRFAKSPLWRIVFSPLFWLLFGRARTAAPKREIPEIPDAQIEAPKPQAFPDPPVIQRRERFQFEMRPALVIGLGQTGEWALTMIKATMRERFDELPDHVQLMLFDTDQYHLYRPPQFAGTALTEDQRLHVGGDLYATIRDPRMRADTPWYPTEGLLLRGNAVSLHEGSGGDRRSARLASIKFGEKIRTAVADHIKKIGNNDLDVILVASANGGTGSGCFLDMAYACRSVLDSLGWTHVGIQGFLCDSTDADEIGLRNRNALFTEIERHLRHRDSPRSRPGISGKIRKPLDQVFIVPGKQSSAQPGELSLPLACEISELVQLWLAVPAFRDSLLRATPDATGFNVLTGFSYRLPVRSLEQYIIQKVAAELVGDRFLDVRLEGDQYVLEPDPQAVGNLLGSLVSQPRQVAFMRFLVGFANPDSFSRAANQSAFASFNLLTEFEKEAIYKTQREQIREALFAWIERSLNGDLRDEDLTNARAVLAARKGRLGATYGAVSKLLEMIDAADRNANSAPTNDPGMREACAAVSVFSRYCGHMLRGFSASLREWIDVLVSGRHHGDVVGPTSLYGFLEKSLADSEQRLRAMKTSPNPNFAVNFERLDDRVEQTSGEARDRQIAHFVWKIGGEGAATQRISLQIAGNEFKPATDTIVQMAEASCSIARENVLGDFEFTFDDAKGTLLPPRLIADVAIFKAGAMQDRSVALYQDQSRPMFELPRLGLDLLPTLELKPILGLSDPEWSMVELVRRNVTHQELIASQDLHDLPYVEESEYIAQRYVDILTQMFATKYPFADASVRELMKTRRVFERLVAAVIRGRVRNQTGQLRDNWIYESDNNVALAQDLLNSLMMLADRDDLPTGEKAALLEFFAGKPEEQWVGRLVGLEMFAKELNSSWLQDLSNAAAGAAIIHQHYEGGYPK